MISKRGFLAIPKIGKEKRMKLCLLEILCFCPFFVFFYVKSASQTSIRKEIFYDFATQSPLKNMIASEKQSFISDINDLRSSLDKLTNKIDRLMEIEKDEEWNYYEDTYISGCTKIKCENILTLSEAKTKCKLSDDCIGITKEKENYQLRAGPGAFSSNIGEKSWMLKLEKCNDELEGEDRINIGYLEHSYEELKGQRFRRPDGKCVFGGKFTHINKLLDFNPQLQFSTLSSPTSCFFKNSSDSIIFGIKSMPESLSFRDAIRDTWLNYELWNDFNFQIKVVFIIGQDGKTNLTDEMKINDDLLVLDFEESHYNLPYKDMAFLRFINDKCSNVDFVFKGDDDILLIPQNLIKEISRVKSSDSIEAIGCKKEPEEVARNPKNKYFIPNQMYREQKWQAYFSGAGYLTTGNFSKELAKMADQTKAVPLDDCWIGILINKMNKRCKFLII
ncbi:unnamed protein product [Oikopleura dioica]|uniref:Hexosyltransferase n=1 Tax=Oikopleura dioica TaxID=34765 RepID=E4X5M5_OIKDI|nr:unnamed protein product [Oikopleura dioica]CBY30718.1 unnamed protein product [Oikopleura dioica]